MDTGRGKRKDLIFRLLATTSTKYDFRRDLHRLLVTTSMSLCLETPTFGMSFSSRKTMGFIPNAYKEKFDRHFGKMFNSRISGRKTVRLM